MNQPKCQLCGGLMIRTIEANYGKGIFLILAGGLLTITGILAIIGIPIAIIGLIVLGKRKGMHVCQNCKHKTEYKL